MHAGDFFRIRIQPLIFCILQILLVFTCSILHTTFWTKSVQNANVVCLFKNRFSWNRLTVNRDGSQDDPCRPLGQVFDEDEGHEGADDDQVSLLQLEGALPVDTDHPHCPEVPDDHPHRWIIHRKVVGFKHFTGKQKDDHDAPELSGSGELSLSAAVV